MASVSQGDRFAARSPGPGDAPWVSPAVHSSPHQQPVSLHEAVYGLISSSPWLSSFRRRGSEGNQKSERALPGVAQLLGHGSTKRKVAGLGPSRGTRLSGRPGPWRGVCERQLMFLSCINVSLPLFSPPSLSLQSK